MLPPTLVLVGTDSTISLVCLGMLASTVDAKLRAWRPTRYAKILGKRVLDVGVAGQNNCEFWVANIQDLCIINLDLLMAWGAKVDVSGAPQASHRQWWLTRRLRTLLWTSGLLWTI